MNEVVEPVAVEVANARDPPGGRGEPFDELRGKEAFDHVREAEQESAVGRVEVDQVVPRVAVEVANEVGPPVAAVEVPDQARLKAGECEEVQPERPQASSPNRPLLRV